MISIIIRTFNEERWIRHCLEAVYRQTYKDIEVVIVDSFSTDKTIERARQFPVKVVTIRDYLPGKALNLGVRESKGEYFACLSAHCIPANNDWLTNLLKNLEDHGVAGVYGRQIPMESTSDADKRDLMITFGLDRKVQLKDPFFHNANSLIPRKIWNAHPFDDKVTNIEDRIWGKTVIDAGYKIVYEPGAPVYHEHGIHQDGNPARCRNVVSIMDSLHAKPESHANMPFTPKDLKIAAFIPLKGPLLRLPDGKPLLEITLDSIRESRFISKCVVLADHENVIAYMKKTEFDVIMRPESLSREDASLEQVFQFGLEQLENQGRFSDIIVAVEATYPFRPAGLLDGMIELLLEKGFDSIIAGFPEYRACWVEGKEDFERIDKEGFIPRNFKHPLQIGLVGLGCVTYPNIIREGHRLGKRIGIYEISDQLASIEVRETQHIPMADHLLKFYRKTKSRRLK